MRSSLFAAAGLAGCLILQSVMAADVIRDPTDHFFHQSFGDLREELATAKTDGQTGLMLMFENDDCPWCKKMRAAILNRSSVQDHFRKHFRILSIDTNGDAMMVNFDGQEMAQKDFALKIHRVRATPTFLFFDLKGNVLTKYIGSTRNEEELMLLGKFVLEGHYKNTNFLSFKRANRGPDGGKS